MTNTEIKKKLDAEYKLIPMHEIEPEARMIAVRWVEKFVSMGGIDLEQKHKLASDIMNYAKLQPKNNSEISEHNFSTIKGALNESLEFAISKNIGFDIWAGKVIEKINEALKLFNQPEGK